MIKNQNLDLVGAYVSIKDPKMDQDCDTMVILIGGQKRAKDHRETAFVHGEVEVSRDQIVHLALYMHRIIAAEQASVDRKRAAMKGGA